MTWETFYEHFDESAQTTIAQRIGALTDFGTPGEIVEVAASLPDEKTASMLLKKALTAGVCFSGEELIELQGAADTDTLRELTLISLKAGVKISSDELEELYCILGAEDFKPVAEQLRYSDAALTPQQIVDMSEDLGTELTNALVEKALLRRASFTPTQILGLEGRADRALLARAAEASDGPFTAYDLYTLEEILDRELLMRLKQKHGVSGYIREPVRRVWSGKAPVRRPGLLHHLLVLISATPGPTRKAKHAFRVGELVLVRYRDQYGYVIDVNDGMYTVRLNETGQVDAYTADDLSRA